MVRLSHLHDLFLYFHRISGLLVLALLLLELLDLLLLRLPLDLTLQVGGFLLLELALGKTLVVLCEGPMANVACAGLVQARVVVFRVSLIQVAVEELLCALGVCWVRVEFRRGSVLELLIEVAQVLHHLVTVVVNVNVALVFRVLDQAKPRFVKRLLGSTILGFVLLFPRFALLLLDVGSSACRFDVADVVQVFIGLLLFEDVILELLHDVFAFPAVLAVARAESAGPILWLCSLGLFLSAALSLRSLLFEQSALKQCLLLPFVLVLHLWRVLGGGLGGNRDRGRFLLLLFLRRRLLGKVVLLLEVLDPGVVEYLDKGQSLCSLVNQDLIDEILVLVREARLEPDLPSHDLVADLPWVDSGERGPPVDELVKEDTKGPDVECVVVIFVLDHLRGHVL